MPTSLREIPGAGRPGRGGARGRGRSGRRSLSGLFGGGRRGHTFRSRKSIDKVKSIDKINLAIGTSFVALALVGGRWLWNANGVDFETIGIENDGSYQTVDTEHLALGIETDVPDKLHRASLTFEGRDVLNDAEETDDGFIYRPEEDLEEGTYELRLTVPRPIFGKASYTARFHVDDTPPALELPILAPVAIDAAVMASITFEDGATLTVDGEEADADEGRLELSFDAPPASPLELVVSDAAGNETSGSLNFPVVYPGARGVHVTGTGWQSPAIRDTILATLRAGRIDSVQLDLKDELGEVNYPSQVPEAQAVGATRDYYDLEQAVDQIHEAGGRVVGRIVVFRDPIYATSKWEQGISDAVIQDTDGNRLAIYDAGFTNIANPDVWQYNIDLAEEAAKAGVDDVLYDYVRRPEGDLGAMIIPGIAEIGTPQDAIVEFLRRSHETLRPYGVYQGASVFGIAASRPEAVGQNIPRMAGNLDYVAPMLYPSHWVSGEYGVDSPIDQPYDIVEAALLDFKRVTAESGIALLLWTQDFTLGGVAYAEEEVRAQIDAAQAVGVSNFLLWDPDVTYHFDALIGLPSPEGD